MKHKTDKYYLIKIYLIFYFIFVGFQISLYGQINLTLESAVEHAMQKSPDIQRTKIGFGTQPRIA